MTNLIPFPPPEEFKPHASGDAFCLSCKHEWIAVCEAGTVQLECPQCHRLSGLFKFLFAPDPETLIRVCNCGCEYFWLTPEGHLCPNCGTYQSY